ncbi:transcription factor 12 isoform X4 [Macrobrachium rosenbergii]|uniref:transcription factor 12 isoform X4 n=1 Tax=Macrobrachium rosenbergii TaxID=79674 RepID=UPI0034D73126
MLEPGLSERSFAALLVEPSGSMLAGGNSTLSHTSPRGTAKSPCVAPLLNGCDEGGAGASACVDRDDDGGGGGGPQATGSSSDALHQQHQQQVNDGLSGGLPAAVALLPSSSSSSSSTSCNVPSSGVTHGGSLGGGGTAAGGAIKTENPLESDPYSLPTGPYALPSTTNLFPPSLYSSPSSGLTSNVHHHHSTVPQPHHLHPPEHRDVFPSPFSTLTFPFQYGSDDFNQDSPRYTSPKPGGAYGEAYFDGGVDVWGASGGGAGGAAAAGAGAVGGSYPYPSPSMMGPSSHHSQPHFMPTHHLQDPIGYDHMASGLPPMSTFRGPGASSTTGGGSVATSSPLYTHSPVPNHTQATPTANTGDALGKALSSIYPGEQTSSSYSSNPGTPVSATSPPPLTSGASSGAPQQWPQPHTPTSPHYDRSLPMPCMPEENLESAIDYLRDHGIEGSRIDERLEDAVNVLQRHAETSGGLPAGPHLGPPTHGGSLPPYPAGLDSHLAGPPNSTFTTLGSHSQDLKALGVPGLGDGVKDKLDVKEELSTHLPTTTVASSIATGTKSGKRSRSTEEDECADPETKALREKERRQANNARERIRVRDINEAFKELGRMCMIHCKNDKAQTKLNILHMAVEVITTLEQQVRERNLNPKAACLKRREEEKSDGSKLPPPHLPHPSSMAPPFPNLPGDHLSHGGAGPH